MSTLIHYPGGAYGTFIEWILTYLTDSELDDTLPFRDHGNAHNFIGNFMMPNGSYHTNVYQREVDDIAEEYTPRFADREAPFSRTHQGTVNLEIVKAMNLQVVNVWFTNKSSHWIFNNRRVKLWTSEMNPMDLYFMDKTGKTKGKVLRDQELAVDTLNKHPQRDEQQSRGYGYADFTTVEDLATWQLRQITSHWYCNGWMEEYFSPQGPIDGLINFQVESLRDNFKEAILDLVKKTGHTAIPNRVEKLDSIEESWRAIQSEMNRDQIVNDYVKNTISGEEYTESDLRFFEEAWIQGELRSRGYEVKCDGLDKFPASTTEMNKLIYKL